MKHTSAPSPALPAPRMLVPASVPKFAVPLQPESADVRHGGDTNALVPRQGVVQEKATTGSAPAFYKRRSVGKRLSALLCDRVLPSPSEHDGATRMRTESRLFLSSPNPNTQGSFSMSLFRGHE